MVMIPPYVPEAFLTMYLPAIYAGLIVGFIGTMAIAMKREEIHILILTDLVGLAMIFVVSAVGTDLAEALILPGLVVELAETLAISEILITREMRKIEQDPRRNLSKSSSLFPQPFSLDMEIMTTAPNFIALVLIGYGIFLTGFTGGAVAGGGIVLYALSKKARGLPVLVLDGIAGVSGIAWCLWIIGFLLFFVMPQYWLLSLFLAACGLLLKVASKVGLIGLLMREDIDKEEVMVMDLGTLGGNLLGTIPLGDIVLYVTPFNLFLFAVLLGFTVLIAFSKPETQVEATLHNLNNTEVKVGPKEFKQRRFLSVLCGIASAGAMITGDLFNFTLFMALVGILNIGIVSAVKQTSVLNSAFNYGLIAMMWSLPLFGGASIILASTGTFA